MPVSIKDYIRTIPDFPKPGIQFRDVTSLLEDATGLRMAVDYIVHRYTGVEITRVAGIEARGFIFGTAVAYKLGVGFVPIRKAGKLPGKVIGRDYQLEYGEDRIEIHADAIGPDDCVLLIDDLIATGGTAEAAAELIRSTGARFHVCCFVVDLPDLGGMKRLADLGVGAYALCEFEGE
jgi:adenine phosphoribosyltransferase